jgi:hypothetical protein
VFSLLVAIAAAPAPVPEQLEFSGYTQASGVTQFLLKDPQAKSTSGWLSLGGAFGGYTLIGFDAKNETLTVEKAGSLMHLRLKATALTAAPEPPVTQTEIDAGLAQPRPTYVYNQQRGTYEVTGFTWRRLTPQEREARQKAQVAAEEKAKEERRAAETAPAAPSSEKRP